MGAEALFVSLDQHKAILYAAIPILIILNVYFGIGLTDLVMPFRQTVPGFAGFDTMVILSAVMIFASLYWKQIGTYAIVFLFAGMILLLNA